MSKFSLTNERFLVQKYVLLKVFAVTVQFDNFFFIENYVWGLKRRKITFHPKESFLFYLN